jgi:hypothetical protein
MAQTLSKIVTVLLLFVGADLFAQDKNASVYNPPDYKDNAQFHRFYKRRTSVAKSIN